MENEKLYKTSEVAEIMNVTKQTVYKWLDILPKKGWFRNHVGQLRFKKWLIDKLKSGQI